MRGWRIAVLLAMAAALLAWAYLSLDRWQRGLIFHPNPYMVETPADRSLVFSEQRIDVEDGQLHGWWIPAASPKAPALLFLHGNAGTISTELAHLARLHQAGFAVLGIDYRGYGLSSALSPSEASVRADARAAWTRLLALAPNATRHMIYGHSLGGAVAIDLASRVEGVDALAVEGTFSSIVAVARSIFPRWWPVPLLVTQRFASDGKIARLTMPKLFIHCSADRIVAPAFGQALYAAAPDPKTQLVIAGGNHNGCPDYAPRDWTAAMRRLGGLKP